MYFAVKILLITLESFMLTYQGFNRNISTELKFDIVSVFLNLILDHSQLPWYFFYKSS